jgi:hypothetical protein
MNIKGRINHNSRDFVVVYAYEFTSSWRLCAFA